MKLLFWSVALALLQQTLPPPYPRPGVDKLLDNEKVQVWNIAWPKGQPTALHRHIYDLAGVYYEPGDRVITATDGTKRQVSTKAWDVTAQRTGLTHIEEGTSDAPLRAVFVEMKQPGQFGGDAGRAGTPAFPTSGATQKLDNERVTIWEFTQKPAPASHRHTHDAVVIVFDGGQPRATWVSRGTVHSDEGGGGGSRVYVIELK